MIATRLYTLWKPFLPWRRLGTSPASSVCRQPSSITSLQDLLSIVDITFSFSLFVIYLLTYNEGQECGTKLSQQAAQPHMATQKIYCAKHYPKVLLIVNINTYLIYFPHAFILVYIVPIYLTKFHTYTYAYLFFYRIPLFLTSLLFTHIHHRQLPQL